MHLRMDDTNPEKEDESHVKAIEEIVRWLGFEWDGPVRYASDYFPELLEAARDLIRRDLAYVDFTPKEKMREMRGTLTSPGTRSRDADNPIEWHAEMFGKMIAGEFDDGACVLRAKIDMASPNINLRDPVLYRIKTVSHDRTGDKYCVYVSYDYAHPFSDAMEGISLSLCTLEFEDHRPFYEWVIANCSKFFKGSGAAHPPVELEFARLELDRGLTSKRKINALVESGKVDGWDDPRLVTLAGLRRRGFTPAALRAFCEEAGISKANSITPFSRVEDFLRIDLDEKAPRRIVVARPVRLSISDGFGPFTAKAPNHPKIDMGERDFLVSSEMWIDVDDVRPEGAAEPGFKRVEPGSVFRIMHAGLIFECIGVKTDEDGAIASVEARLAPEKKPRAAIHGLSIPSAVPVEIWEPDVITGDDDDPLEFLSIRRGYCEPAALETNGTWQAVRYGWCVKDLNHPERLIRSAALKSSA